ncbi:MAG: polymer-forming cytoskeletal protein [Planctomycetota bacterium]
MLSRLRRIRPTLAERRAPKLPAHATRVLRCYHCGGSFEASAFAESTGCSRCGGAVRIPDITIDRGHWGGALLTAGRVHVLPGSTVRASLIVASGDVLIDGAVHAMVLSGGRVHVTATGRLRGGARCRSLVVEPGAVVLGGPFESHAEVLGSVDIETAARSTPGKGPAARVPALESEVEPKPAPPPIIRFPKARRADDTPRLRVVP